MINLYVQLKPNFTVAEKEACMPIIEKLMNIAHTARRNGIGILKQDIKNEQNYFLKMSLNLIINAAEPCAVKKIMRAVIISGEYLGFELLSRLIIAEGVLSIQQGDKACVMLMKMSAMLGEKYIMEMDEKNICCR